VKYLHDLLVRAGKRAGLPIGPSKGRIHDLRHTFAVRQLIQWYKEGVNVQARMPYLSAYLGHRDVRSTQTYLTMTPELRELANARFLRYRRQKLAMEGHNGRSDVASRSSK
jgi:integrase/recombinase XerD